MRGDTLYKILDFLEDQSLSTLDFLTAFLKSGYGASMSKIDYEYKMQSRKSDTYKVERERRRNLQKYISKLKSDGLILENSRNEIIISKKGLEKLKLMKQVKILDKNLYKKEKGDRVIIISYDLPVSFNKERDQLREILKILGLHMVHKSVWVGKVKIPKELILALEKIGILKFIEILEVTKSGSLKEL